MKKLRGKIELGPDIILFGDSSCIACVTQVKMLYTHFNKLNKKLDVKYYNLGKKQPPSFISPSGTTIKPTWYFPESRTSGVIIQGLVKPNEFLKLMKKGNSFGQTVMPGQLAKYGRNFDKNEGFQINNSWTNEMKNKWGNILDSGTLGREFGPGKTDEIYKSGYFNNIRMAIPGGDLSETLYSNRNCNIMNNQDAQTMNPGLLYDSKNPQTAFGKKKKTKSNFKPTDIRIFFKPKAVKPVVKPVVKSNSPKGYKLKKKLKRNLFGNLYSQMGPSYATNYLVEKDTVKKLHGGATQHEPPRPGKVENKKTFIGQAKEYSPLGKIGPGTVLSIKNNKIKIN